VSFLWRSRAADMLVLDCKAPLPCTSDGSGLHYWTTEGKGESMKFIEDVPEHLAEPEFGGQPSGGAAAWAVGAIVVVLCAATVAAVALLG
jgi:hypothetical protein